jgi:hypothetical protein
VKSWCFSTVQNTSSKLRAEVAAAISAFELDSNTVPPPAWLFDSRTVLSFISLFGLLRQIEGVKESD